MHHRWRSWTRCMHETDSLASDMLAGTCSIARSRVPPPRSNTCIAGNGLSGSLNGRCQLHGGQNGCRLAHYICLRLKVCGLEVGPDADASGRHICCCAAACCHTAQPMSHDRMAHQHMAWVRRGLQPCGCICQCCRRWLVEKPHVLRRGSVNSELLRSAFECVVLQLSTLSGP